MMSGRDAENVFLKAVILGSNTTTCFLTCLSIQNCICLLLILLLLIVIYYPHIDLGIVKNKKKIICV